MSQSYVPIKRALISVSDKSGLLQRARILAEQGIELISTGGTAKTLKAGGLTVRDVSELTEFPEMMDGRVKTLHPAIHGGLLYLRDEASHIEAAQAHNIAPIDLVYINLYPFEKTVAAGEDFETCIENIDIGGPAMLRAAAKNHRFVASCTQAEDLDRVLESLQTHKGCTSLDLRKRLAANTYARTAAYDSVISRWYADQLDISAPPLITLGGTLHSELRYGENPHQSAALYYTGDDRPGIANAQQIQGKALSYNNMNDTDAAFELIGEFGVEQPSVAIIKHANPCGVAMGKTLLEAYEKALACDSTSAFGGIVALNQTIDAKAAEAITKIFTEVVIAPDADPDALEIFAKKKNLRLLLTHGVPDPKADGLTAKTIAGGLLVQSRDSGFITEQDLICVTRKQPMPDQIEDMLFAWRVAKHVKSNTIVYAKQGATVGIGAGQMSRIDAAHIAALKAEDAARIHNWSEPRTRNCVAASDAFFPFPDGLLKAAKAGASAIIQPGGSIRDKDVIAAADEAGLVMMLTGQRHFRH